MPQATPTDFATGWSWIDEGSFPAGNFTGDNEYSNWETNEPDNRPGSGDENCLTIDVYHGKWHDRVCDLDMFPFPFILEANLTRENQSLDGCMAALDVDPLVSVLASDEAGSYVCTYLSDAIDNLIATAASVDSVVSLLGSMSGSLSPEQIAMIAECVGQLLTN
jgi:hypothetical protein